MEGKIEAIASSNYPTSQEGIFSRGVKLNGAWNNAIGTDDEIRKILGDFERGDLVEYESEDQGGRLALKKITLKEKARNDDAENFDGLLAAAHKDERKLKSIFTVPVAIDNEKQSAVFKAVVAFKDGSEFSAHGDADQKNIASGNVRPHWLRMAETRAIGRALRFATNNADNAKIESKEAKK